MVDRNAMHTHLIRTFVAATALYLVALTSSHGQQPMLEGSAGIDAKGVRHTWSDASAKNASWQGDIVKFVPPSYPTRARRAKQRGSGVFRLAIEATSGKVTGDTVLKPTGVDVLDDSAVFALRMWRIKPGAWRELDIPITFSL